jgi:hypothetical protein
MNDMFMYRLGQKRGGGGSSGGGAEIPTCTMRFVDSLKGEEENDYYTHGVWCGGYHYMRYKDGVLSLESHNDIREETDFDITFENVVCGSPVMFVWSDTGDGDWLSIHFEGAGSNMETLLNDFNRTMNETTLFKAPTEANAVCTVYLCGEKDFWNDEW